MPERMTPEPKRQKPLRPCPETRETRPLCRVLALSLSTLLCLSLCLTLLSCSHKVYVPVVEVIAPPMALYAAKTPPPPPVALGNPMTPRQMAEWLSRYMAWGGEMVADREAIREFMDHMNAETKDMGKGKK